MWDLIDSSLLARECAPEAPGVGLTVPISELWKWTFEVVEGSPASEALKDKWAREDYRDRPSWREKYGLTSVAHELMTRGFWRGDFATRVHDGAAAWRIPSRAFQGWRQDIDLEMTWTGGKLWQMEASEPFRAIADLGLPLLTTESDAETYKRGVLLEVAALEAASPAPPSELKAMLRQQIDAAEAAMPSADPEAQRNWVAEWSVKARWPLREAVLWVAFRDLDEVAKAVLTSFWAGAEREGVAGALLAHCDLEQQRDIGRIVESRPEVRLMHALTVDLRAHGLFEGAGPVALIDGPQWENLKFGVPPVRQRGSSNAWKSAACTNDQIPSVAWRGHWTGIAVDREGLFAAFRPLPTDPGVIDDSDDAVDVTIRRLTAERGNPISRNAGPKIVRPFHTSRSLSSIRKRIEALYPEVRPGPRIGSRNHAP